MLINNNNVTYIITIDIKLNTRIIAIFNYFNFRASQSHV